MNSVHSEYWFSQKYEYIMLERPSIRCVGWRNIKNANSSSSIKDNNIESEIV